MLDQNLLFADGATVTTNGQSSEVTINKTPAKGFDVEIDVTAVTGSGTPTVTVKVQDADTTDWADLVNYGAITATGSHRRVVQTKKKKLRLDYSAVGGTSPNFTITAGIVSGKPFYAAA